MKEANEFLSEFSAWAEKEENIPGVILVGSQARGTARPDSDIDLVIIATDPTPLVSENNWITQFGPVSELKEEDWGPVHSKRTFFEDGLEVEFGVTTKDWLHTAPVDEGTRKVLTDGYKVLVNKADIDERITTIVNS